MLLRRIRCEGKSFNWQRLMRSKRISNCVIHRQLDIFYHFLLNIVLTILPKKIRAREPEIDTWFSPHALPRLHRRSPHPRASGGTSRTFGLVGFFIARGERNSDFAMQEEEVGNESLYSSLQKRNLSEYTYQTVCEYPWICSEFNSSDLFEFIELPFA